ncbi:hypothetical protein GOP47_0020365 [Adiantum capillus-veneris]|uniref:Uncharacterized protein n=1 Tax=Adiantum capillus-veneris TaxID=13818 RepID=A0A9D4UDA0_ADICA|nr:hypothetical protein GOP47_0020365 [Adiantum capillus-veneris]
MHLIKAHEDDARLEQVEEVSIRSQRIQRGIFRVPNNLLSEKSEVVKVFQEEVSVPEPATRKVAVVQELTSAKEEVNSSQSSSSAARALDIDSMWEMESMSSRYDTYDVFHVDEVENSVCELPTSHLKVEEKRSRDVEMSCV